MNWTGIVLLQILALLLLAAEAFLVSMGLLALATVATLAASLYLARGSSAFWRLLAFDLLVFPLLGWKLLALAARNSPLALPHRLESGGADGSEALPAIGSIGTTLTDLHPCGKVRIADRILDAEANGQYLAEGTRIVVIGSFQNRLSVRAAREGTSSSPAPGD